MKFAKTSCLIAFVIAVCSCTQEKVETLTEDGAWCWFSDPRAIHLHGDEEGILTGWVKADGSVETALFHSGKEKIHTQNVYPELEIDDHDNPAFVETVNGYMAFYSKHSKTDLYYHHSSDKEGLLFKEAIHFDPTSEKEMERFPKHHITYANPFMLEKEGNRIYCFGRWTGYKPNVMWSDDQGLSFSKSRVMIAEEGFRPDNRPYVKYFSDGKSKIHIVFTDGHPRNEPLNSVYYMYYEAGAFYRAGGELICRAEQLPLQPKEASVIYKASQEDGRAWIYDMAADEAGNIAILYARYPNEQTHLYHYALIEGSEISDKFICNAGKWFPQTMEGKTEREPHYSGGMAVASYDLNTVYVSQEQNSVFEIFAYELKGQKWKRKAITKDSEFDQVRPVVPRNYREGDTKTLLWMENEKYVHYSDYNCRIVAGG